MQELITVQKTTLNGAEVNSVNSREIHSQLELKTPYSNWIKRAIEKYGFEENQDFTINKFVIRNNAQLDYIVTLDMAKELCMLDDSDKGRAFRKYLIGCEKQLNKPMSQLEMIIANAQASIEQNARINILEARQEEILELTVKAIEEIKNNGDVLPSIGFVSLKTFDERSNMSLDFVRAMIKCGKYDIACEHGRKHTTDLGRVQNYTAYKQIDLENACADVDSKAQWTTDRHTWKFSTIVGRQYKPRNKK